MKAFANAKNYSTVLLALISACLLVTCKSSESDSGSNGNGGEPAPQTLSAWGLFQDVAAQDPNDDVYPFEVTSPLFSDGALKHRFFFVPDGGVIAYDDEDAWDFPVGSVFIKTFAFPVDERSPGLGEQLIETRIYERQASGWKPFNYLWNDTQTDADFLSGRGETVAVSYIDAVGATVNIPTYNVPSEGQCNQCHGAGSTARILGALTPMLNRDQDPSVGVDNQVDFFDGLGLFDSTPLPFAQRRTFADPDDGGVSATERARSYLNANCSHCHSSGGERSDLGLFLDYDRTDPVLGTPSDWGACRTTFFTASCNHVNYIVSPGDPGDSYIPCRVDLAGTGQMPPIDRSVIHDLGVDLLTDWITDMTAPACN